MSSSEVFSPSGFGLQIFKQRYAIHSEETWEEACRRVSNFIAGAETNGRRVEWEDKFYSELVSNRFIPGGRILYGSGRAKAGLINCFVIPSGDSREDWSKTLGDMLIISGLGGGVGINFSSVRPRGTPIRGSGGEATGAVSLMELINSVGEVIKGGSGRRSALMQCLNIDHPDLLEFIDKKFTDVNIDFENFEEVKSFVQEKLKIFDENYFASLEATLKTEEGREYVKNNLKSLMEKNLNNANVSIVFNEDPVIFFDKVRNKEQHEFVWQGKVINKIRADKLWERIVSNARHGGEPGWMNIHLANKMSNMQSSNKIVASNPCSEILMSPNEVCCLGQIVLPRFIENDEFNWAKLAHTIDVAVRFLDNVLDVTVYPTQEIKEKASKTRRIGLGITGLHDVMLILGYKYSSDRGRNFASKIMEFVKNKSYEASSLLALERGSFYYYNKEDLEKSEFIQNLKPSVRYKVFNKGLRNVAVNSIAPTGTVSIVCGVSSGVEPIMGAAYQRKFWVGDKKKTEIVVHPLFEKFVNEGKDVSHFEYAEQIDIEEHIKMQVQLQKHVDNAISKTCLISSDITEEKLSELLMQYIPEIKGFTVYPTGSRGDSPVVPLPLEEAIEIVKSKKGVVGTSEEQEFQDCPNGVCALG